MLARMLKWMGDHWPRLTCETSSQVHRFLAENPASERIVDVGAGHCFYRPDILRLDAHIRKGIDLVGDAQNLPLRSAIATGVICLAVLEHVPQPDRVMMEIHRILQPQGSLYLEVPFIQGYHPCPEDYWRWTEDGIRLFCCRMGFEVLEQGCDMGPASAFCWITHDLAISFFDSYLLRRILSRMMRLFLTPVKYLDYFLRLKKRAGIAAGSLYVICRKNDGAIDCNGNQ